MSLLSSVICFQIGSDWIPFVIQKQQQQNAENCEIKNRFPQACCPLLQGHTWTITALSDLHLSNYFSGLLHPLTP